MNVVHINNNLMNWENLQKYIKFHNLSHPVVLLSLKIHGKKYWFGREYPEVDKIHNKIKICT